MLDGDTWHFNERCSQWPRENYVELEFAAAVNEVCNECHVKDTMENPA